MFSKIYQIIPKYWTNEFQNQAKKIGENGKLQERTADQALVRVLPHLFGKSIISSLVRMKPLHDLHKGF